MSSSNRVRIAVIPETSYGVTPGAGNFDTARFTSESLSGTPETVESATIRSDRMSQGQVVTGLTVAGDINSELAKEGVIDSFIESAMYNTFQTTAAINVDLTIDATAKTIDRAAGDFTTEVVVGDVLKLAGFSNSVNNTEIMVAEIVDADTIRYVGPETMVDEGGSGTSFQVSDKVSIGSTKKSFSMEKAFLDLTDKAIIYKGQIVANMNMNFAYGEIASMAFTFNGNGYQAVDQAADFITDGRVINAPATSNSMNGSIDMPFIVNSAVGVLDESTFCIQSVELTLNNNLTPQNCVGKIAPEDYSEGTAQIGVSISAYLADENWSLLAKKLTQEPFAVGFLVKNIDGYYGFFLPAVQVSFEDPSSGGQNQDVILNMTGTAKIGDNGESALTIYKS